MNLDAMCAEAMARIRHCRTCKHWDRHDGGDHYGPGQSQGLGRCTATKMFWEMTQWSDDGERVFKPEAANLTAFCQDGSDYMATLYTRPEHGCTMHSPD